MASLMRLQNEELTSMKCSEEFSWDGSILWAAAMLAVTSSSASTYRMEARLVGDSSDDRRRVRFVRFVRFVRDIVTHDVLHAAYARCSAH